MIPGVYLQQEPAPPHRRVTAAHAQASFSSSLASATMAEVAVLLHRQIASPARFPATSSFFDDPR
ncbi:hypothetical protein JCGZ_16826 [Jatropha curcas]|uniref:Uncharacterized protein n=1 Tax=Jatropha curcas TaxID=180498 RepID=A0A067LH57_JATCU|nr:hypothetical protein JCGZ_16826 [Jatropha curcas]